MIHRFVETRSALRYCHGPAEWDRSGHKQVPFFVGLKPEEGLVCSLLMKGALRDGMKSWIWLSNWDKVDYHFIPTHRGRQSWLSGRWRLGG